MSKPYLSDEASYTLAQLRHMISRGRRGKLRTSSCLPTLYQALRDRHQMSRIAVDEALRDLHRNDLVGYQADAKGMPVSGFISVTLQETTPDSLHETWVETLKETGLGYAAEDLSRLSAALNGMEADDLVQLAHGLLRLHSMGNQTGHSAPRALEDAGFNVSARHVMGSSKVLTALSARMLKALGLPAHLQTSSPRYVVCAGPNAPVATLLIENPRAFENALRSGISRQVALVCTYGFGLSYLGNGWLHDDEAGQHEHERPILLVREGNPPALSTLLMADKLFLWADLDLGAIDIYRSLRSNMPQLRMSRIYQAMLPMLADPSSSHPYAELFDKAGQLRGGTADASDLDESCRTLWHACQRRAVDQEAVKEADICSLGTQAL